MQRITQPREGAQSEDVLCSRCSKIDFEMIWHTFLERGDPGKYDRRIHLPIDTVAFSGETTPEVPSSAQASLPKIALSGYEKHVLRDLKTKLVFDLGPSLIMSEDALRKCTLCYVFATVPSTTYKGDHPEASLSWFVGYQFDTYNRVPGHGDLVLFHRSMLSKETWEADEDINDSKLVVTIAAENSNNYSPPFFGPDINYAFIQSEIQCCRLQRRQSLHNVVADMKLIDCQLRCVRTSDGSEEYVALSYVWGPAARSQKPFVTSNGEIIETRVTQTVADAIKATLALGKRYLWIDRYCIDQNNSELRQGQLGSMDRIFAQSWATIIAHGSHDDFGLPGLQGGRPNRVVARSGKVLISPYGRSLENQQGDSSYRTRCWTLQESLLSSHLLSFTEDQLLLTCRHGTVCEAYLDQSHPKRSIRPSSISIGQLAGVVLSRTDDRLQFEDALGEYCRRDLTYETDALAAFRGILAHIGLDAHFGVPILSSTVRRTPGKLLSKSQAESTLGAAIGLSWRVVDSYNEEKAFTPEEFTPEQIYGDVCALFPSWSWASCRRGHKRFDMMSGDNSCKERSVLMHAAVVCSETLEDSNKLIAWSAFDDSDQLRSARSQLQSVSHLIHLTTIVVDFALRPQQSHYTELEGCFSDVDLRWRFVETFGVRPTEVNLYPDPRPPCACHSHMHLPYDGSSWTVSEDIVGQAALLFVSKGTGWRRSDYAEAHFLALRRNCRDATAPLRRIGVIKAFFRSGAIDELNDGRREKATKRLQQKLQDALVEEWNSGRNVKTVRIA